MATEVITNSSYRVFVIIFSFTVAIFISSFVFIPPLIALWIIIIGLAILIDWSKVVLILSIVLISFGFGALRYSVKDFHSDTQPNLHGFVSSEPEEKENFKQFVLRSDNGVKVQVSAPLFSKVQYGDEVELSGKFKVPGIITDELSGRQFDYGKFLAKDDIYYTLNSYTLNILSHGHGNIVRAALLKVKSNFVEHTEEILPEPAASLLNGLIVSGKQMLSKNILEEFRRAGVVHIVVLSGFNITLVADFLRRILRNRYASLIGIILFVIMTGAGASIVRAAIMAIIAIGAKLFRRDYSASRALIFAGFLMLIQNPKILVFDPSFQLSFLATLGLILFMNPVSKKLKWVKYHKMREILSQTLATQITVLPLLIYLSGDASLVSIPANLLILGTVPATMLVGFIAVMLSYIHHFIALPFTYVSYLLLSWILLVAHALGSLKFATIKIPNLALGMILIFYLIFAAFTKFSSTLAQFKFAKKSSM